MGCFYMGWVESLGFRGWRDLVWSGRLFNAFYFVILYRLTVGFSRHTALDMGFHFYYDLIVALSCLLMKSLLHNGPLSNVVYYTK